MNILQFESKNCKDCCKCIGVCPVKAIEIRDRRAMIVEDDCILCGNCTIVCPQGIKHDLDDIPKVQKLIAEGKRVVASVDSSYIAYFDGCGFNAFSAALKKLGFAAAYETAEGSYIVRKRYEELLAEGKMQTIITSNCAAVNNYISRHMPEAIPYLAPVMTPLQAHAKLIHKDDPEAIIVSIGPCIAQKAECLAEGSEVLCSIGFGEFSRWLKSAGVEIEKGEPTPRRRSRLYSVAGGSLTNLNKTPKYDYLAVNGPQNCIATIKDAANGKLTDCFIVADFCNSGCVGGPSFAKRKMSFTRTTLLVTNDAVDKIPTADSPDYDIESPCDLTVTFEDRHVERPKPTQRQLQAIFRKMGKEGPEDVLNCGMCGYSSCYEKAVAVFMGRAEVSMCLPYMKKRAESLSDKILSITPNAVVAVDMDLKVLQINHSACEMFRVEPHEVLHQSVSRLIDEFDFVELIQSGKSHSAKSSFLPEYNLYLQQDFYFDAASGIGICIMKDMSEEKQRQNLLNRRRTEIAGIADDIEARQLRIVNEIASLLGETAAETKAAMSELKKAVMMQREDNE